MNPAAFTAWTAQTFQALDPGIFLILLNILLSPYPLVTFYRLDPTTLSIHSVSLSLVLPSPLLSPLFSRSPLPLSLSPLPLFTNTRARRGMRRGPRRRSAVHRTAGPRRNAVWLFYEFIRWWFLHGYYCRSSGVPERIVVFFPVSFLPLLVLICWFVVSHIIF